MSEESLFVEAPYVEIESCKIVAQTDMPKHSLWERSRDMNGLTLTLRRTRNVPKNEGVKITYATELVLCGKTLPLAPMSNESNADWLVDRWVKTLSPILDKYESAGFIAPPTEINDGDSFIRAAVLNKKEKH